MKSRGYALEIPKTSIISLPEDDRQQSFKLNLFENVCDAQEL